MCHCYLAHTMEVNDILTNRTAHHFPAITNTIYCNYRKGQESEQQSTHNQQLLLKKQSIVFLIQLPNLETRIHRVH